MKYFSRTTLGFYDDSFHGAKDKPGVIIPADAVEVAEEKYNLLFAAQASGKMIADGGDGNPVAVDRPPPPPDVLWSQVRKQRDNLLAASDWSQFNDSPLSPADRARWATYRQVLRDLPMTQINPAQIVWPKVPGTAAS